MAAPVLANRMVCFVQKVGTDDAGVNAVGAPQSRLTIAAALADLAANYPAASSTNYHIVSVGPGVYLEAAIALPPWTWIEGTCDGEGQPTTFISLQDGTASITLSAAWSLNSTARGGLGDLSVTAAAGSPIMDFTMPVPNAGNPARTVELYNVHHNLTTQLFEATSTGDIFRATNCKQYGTAADTIAIHGGTSLIDNFLSAAAVLFGDVGGLAATIQAYGIYITSATGGLTFSTTTGGGITARIGSCDNRNLTLNITGAGALAVSADATSIPLTANVFYTGTATTTNLIRTTDSGGIAPSPATFSQITRTGNRSSAAWGTAGAAINDTANTFTDTSSAGATAGVTVIRSFGVPTIACGGTVVYADVTNMYVAGPPVVTGGSATNVWSVYVDGGNFRMTTGGIYFGAATPGNISGVAGALTIAAAGTNQTITLNPSGSGNINLNANGSTPNYVQLKGNNFAYGTTSANVVLTGTASGLLIFRNHLDSASVAILNDNGTLLLGGLSTVGTGVLQFPAATTASGGITFGADTNFYRVSTGTIRQVSSGTNVETQLLNSSILNAGMKFGLNASLNVFISNTEAGSIILSSGNATTLTLDASQRSKFSGQLWLSNAYVAGAVAQTGSVLIYDSAGTALRVLVANP